MPLERQVISIPLAQGVDTKTDAKQVAAGKLLELENGVFTTLKAIRKRDGNVALDRRISNGAQVANIAKGRALAVFQNELLEADGSALYSYDNAQDLWVKKGQFTSLLVSDTPVVRDNYDQRCPDGAIHPSGLEAYAWEDSSGSPAVPSSSTAIRYAILDGYSGQVVVSSKQLTSYGIKPRVLCVNNVFLFYFVDAIAKVIKLGVLPVSTPTASITIHDLTGSDLTENSLNVGRPNYDACVTSNTISLAFSNAADTTTLRAYSFSSPQTPLYAQAIIPNPSGAITVFPTKNGEPDEGPTVAYTSTPSLPVPGFSSVRYATYSVSLTTLISSGTVIDPIGSNYVFNLAGCQSSSSGIGFHLYVSTVDGSLARVSRVTFFAPPIPGNPFVFSVFGNWRFGAALWAKPFRLDETVYVPVSFAVGLNKTTIQKTYFLCSDDTKMIAYALSGLAGDFPRPLSYASGVSPPTFASRPMLSGVWQVRDGVFRIACCQQALTSGAGLDTAFDVSALTFDLANTSNTYANSTLANNLHFTGGMLQMYDGVQVVEHGFNLYPDYVTTSEDVIHDGHIAAGKYTYAVCYEWFDAQGNLHQSKPALSSQITVLANDAKVTLSFPYLEFTNKNSSTNPVQIVVYRTEDQQNTLYRVSSLTAPTFNQIGTGSSASFTDTLSDADLRVRPVLYTQPLAVIATGQPTILENFPAPPSGLVQLHRNRIWVQDSTNPLQLWYSKDVFPGYAVEFNAALYKQIDPRGGPITALATVDDKLLVFKRNHIFFIVGQGPLNTGENNDLSDAILITTDCGCIDPRSVVGTPVGIMFQSAKGIYLIDRSLQVQYIGAPVEAYNKETITSATLVANTNQVRFTLENGKTLVFDYFVQQWGTFTNQFGVDSLVWQDTMMLLRANGSVLRETPGVFTDAGSPIRLKLSTSWLSFANVQGFQRVRRAQILGGWRSPHNLLVSVAVDFNDNIVQQATVTPTLPIMYGESSPYGYESVYGGSFQLYQWRIDLARQKTQAVKFTIEDLPEATAGTGEGMTLTSIGFEVGAKTGLNKVPASQIFS